MEWENIAVDAFGTALGNSFADAAKPTVNVAGQDEPEYVDEFFWDQVMDDPQMRADFINRMPTGGGYSSGLISNPYANSIPVLNSPDAFVFPGSIGGGSGSGDANVDLANARAADGAGRAKAGAASSRSIDNSMPIYPTNEELDKDVSRMIESGGLKNSLERGLEIKREADRRWTEEQKQREESASNLNSKTNLQRNAEILSQSASQVALAANAMKSGANPLISEVNGPKLNADYRAISKVGGNALPILGVMEITGDVTAAKDGEKAAQFVASTASVGVSSGLATSGALAGAEIGVWFGGVGAPIGAFIGGVGLPAIYEWTGASSSFKDTAREAILGFQNRQAVIPNVRYLQEDARSTIILGNNVLEEY